MLNTVVDSDKPFFSVQQRGAIICNQSFMHDQKLYLMFYNFNIHSIHFIILKGSTWAKSAKLSSVQRV